MAVKGQSEGRRPKGDVYAVHRWDVVAGRWVSTLNAAGEEAFRRVMADYGDRPVKILANRSKKLLQAANRHPDRDGVHQAAALGVWKGIIRFNSTRGVQLITSVGVSVEAEVREFLWPKSGQSQRAQTEGGMWRPDAEIGAFGCDGWSMLADRRAESPDEGAAGRELVERLGEWLGRMPKRERFVLERRFYHKNTLNEVARRLGVGEERVRQIESRALERLRDMAQVEPADVPSSPARQPAKRPTSTAAILNHVRENPGLTARQIADQTAIPLSLVKSMLKRFKVPKVGEHRPPGKKGKAEWRYGFSPPPAVPSTAKVIPPPVKPTAPPGPPPAPTDQPTAQPSPPPDASPPAKPPARPLARRIAELEAMATSVNSELAAARRVNDSLCRLGETVNQEVSTAPDLWPAVRAEIEWMAETARKFDADVIRRQAEAENRAGAVG